MGDRSRRISLPIAVAGWWILVAHQLCLFKLVQSFSTPPQSNRIRRCLRHVEIISPRIYRCGATLRSTPSASSPISEETDTSETNLEDDAKDDDVLDMPWSDVQNWALKDNISKFTVTIRPPNTGGKSKRYAMWRTLSREVPELAGYPIPFLMQMHQRLAMKGGNSVEDMLGVLPMVDDFEFTSNGGVAGRAYGLPGIADGTRIQTPPLLSAESTVPLGYVTTQGEQSATSENGVGFSYELGTCSSSSTYALDGTERSAALQAARRLVLEGAADSTKGLAVIAKEAAVTGSGLLTDAESNQDLVYLGGATTMLLASAAAIGMLSHHLTVNVFWV